MTNIRNEYAELTKENNQLKKDLLQFQEYYKQWNQKFVTRKLSNAEKLQKKVNR